MITEKDEYFVRKTFDLAISAGKKGYDSFGALLVSDGELLETAENTADYARGLFGHAEFNLVHKCANKYDDKLLMQSVLYTSTAPCTRCLLAIASLGIRRIVAGVSYAAFARLLPFEPQTPDYEAIFREMGVDITLESGILEEEGMKVFEYWGGEYRPLAELLEESAQMKRERGIIC